MSLREIAKTGTFDQIKGALHSHTANAQDELSDALSATIMRKDIASVVLLLENGAPVNCWPSEHMPPLHCAVEQRSPELIRLLCSHGADVNYPNESGYTALHLAVDVEADTAWQRGESPSGEIVQLLLSLGADPIARDISGNTPLSIAEQYGFSYAIELLRRKGNKL